MRILIASVLMIVVAASPAIAETWKCDYTGTWSTTGSADSGNFNWSLTWKSAPGGWRMIGDYNDKYGSSYLDGTCKNKSCSFLQTYKSGSLNGAKYTWTGTYKDRWENKRRTINTFAGTWRAHRGSNNGRWSGTAVCNKL